MTDLKGSSEIDPYLIGVMLETALTTADWILNTDAAGVALARRLAHALDISFNTGELKEVPALAARFTQILAQLHLTVETRTQGNKEEVENGLGYVTDYLRVFQAPTSKPKLELTKRGANSKQPS